MIKPAICKYSPFFMAINILLNKINIVHNATLHTLALFLTAMMLCRPMNTGVSWIFGEAVEIFCSDDFVCGLGLVSLIWMPYMDASMCAR